MSSSGLIGSSTAAAYSLPASSLSSAAMLSASLSALPSSIGAGHSLSSMFSQALNARSASGNGNSNASSAGQNVMNYLSANVNYAAINPNSLNNSSSSSPSTGMTPLPAPSPASYLYPPYSHSHDPSPNSGTPYPIPVPVPSYPYGNVNVYYPPGGTANSNVNVNVNAYPNTPLMYTNVQNRSAALGSMHNSGSSNNIRSMQSFDPIPSAFDGNPASSSASAAFQSIARSQTNLGVALSQQQQRRAHELYTNFNESLNEAQPAQPQSQSAPFYPAAGSGMPTPSPLQTNSSAAAAYHMNHRMTGGASAMQQLAPPTDNSSSNFDAYAQTSFPYRVTLPLAMQPAPPRMHSPQQLGMHPQTPSTAYLQSSGGMTEDMRSRKRKPATDASDTSTSDNTPADHSTSPNSPSVSASPFILAHVASHPHSHTAAALHPQLHQSLLSQAHAQRATHSLLHGHTHPHAHATFHGHQPLPAAVVHPLAHAGMYSASHPSFMSAIPAMGGGSPGVDVLSSSSVAVLSELTDEQLEQEAKFVLGDRQCELMTVMLREVGAWHRRQYWAGKLKESNDGAWRDFLNIARNRSLDLQTLEHHWQSRVCNPFDGHNMDKFNRRLAYLGLQVEWRRGTQKSEYRIIRIARMMPVEGNKSHHAEAPMQGLVGAHAQGKKLNYRSAMWYKRAKRNSDADESAEEDAKVKSAAGATAPSRGADSDSQEDSNDEEVMAIQQQSRQAATVAVAAAAVAGAPTTAISSSDQSQSQSVPLSNSTVSIEVSLDPNRSGQQNKSSGGVLTEFSSSEDDEAEEEQSENVWSPQSASAISSSSSIESFSDLVDWSITEMSDFLFDLMKSHVRPDSHSSDWHSPADWSLLLKRQNVALWNHFVQRCRSRGCAVSMLNRTWRQAFRRPFLYDNLVQWNTRLAHLADPFLIEARSDLQTQRQQFRIAAMQKTAPQATQKSMMIDNGDESKMNQQKAHSSAAENSQFGSDRSAPSPFDSSALDSQKPMDTITIHHPIHVHTNPNPNAFAHQHIAAELFHMTANGNSSSSPSSSSPSASTSTALASFVPHAACASAVARLSSTPTDMHVATSSAAITSESRASAAKLFVF